MRLHLPKPLKKLGRFLGSFALFATALPSSAQVSQYSFTQSTGTYTPINGGTLIVANTVSDPGGDDSAAMDDYLYAPVTLPFAFNYNGAAYTTARASSNGWIMFGTGSPGNGGGVISNTSTALPGAIAGFGSDLKGQGQSTATVVTTSNVIKNVGNINTASVGALIQGAGIPAGTTITAAAGDSITLSATPTTAGTGVTVYWTAGDIRMEAIGTAPNRTIVFQFRNVSQYTGPDMYVNFQIRLKEGGGIAANQAVEIVYGSCFTAATTSTPQVGLRGATASDFNIRTNTLPTTVGGWAGTVGATVNTATMFMGPGFVPTSGLSYIWAPPSGSCVAGTAPANGGSITAVSGSTVCTGAPVHLTLSGFSAAYGANYQWQTSTDGITYTTASSTTNLPYYVTPALTVNTYYRVRVRCGTTGGDSVLSAPILITVQTPPAATTVATLPYSQSFSNWISSSCGVSDRPGTEWTTTPFFGNAAWRRNDQGATANWTGLATGAYPALSTADQFSARFHSTANATTVFGSMLLNIDMSPAGNKLIGFKYINATGVDSLFVDQSIDGGTTYTTLGAFGISATWQDRYVGSTSTTANTIIRFRGKGSTATSTDIGIDSLNIAVVPCLPPGVPVVSAINTNGATLTWTAPAITPSNGYQYEVRSSGAPGSGSVGLGTSGANGTTSTPVTGLFGQTVYTVYVRSDCGGGTFSPWVAASTSFTTSTSCGIPTGVTASPFSTTNSATLQWTSSTTGTPQGWQISYGTGITTPAAGTMVFVPTNPYTLNGLTPGTFYTYFVRSVCGANDTGLWSSGYTFSTACPAFTTFPFTESFEANSTTKVCWKVVDGNNDGDRWNLSSTIVTGHTGAMEATLYTDFNAGANKDWLISPALTLGANKRLRYWYRAQSSGEPNDYTIRISTAGSDTSNFTTTLMPLTSVSNTAWQENTINLSAYTGTVYIAFYVPPGGLDGYYLHIDDFVVEDIPNCLEPTSVTASATSISAATLNWTASTSAPTGGYQYEVRTSGAAGSGNTGLAASGSTAAGVTTANVNTGLTAATAYTVYVRSNCGLGNFSAWTAAVTFVTPFNCAAATPITCGPSSGTASQTFTLTPTGSVYNPVIVVGGGNAPFATPGSEKLYSFTPSVTGVYQLNVSAATGGYADYFVKPASGGCGNSDWVYWDDVNSPSGTTGAPGSAGGLPDTMTLQAGVQYFILVDAESSTTNMTQTFNIICAPTCGQPITVNATAITPNSATLGWTQPAIGNPAQWQVSYGPGITSPNAGTSVFATANSLSLSSLTPGTSYTVYVRAVCGAGDTSLWSTAYTFATAPTCSIPDTLSATGITPSSANLGWTNGTFGTATTWQISYGVTGTTAANGTKVIVPTNPSYTLSGLAQGTNYVFFVRSICAPGDTSAWSSSFAFTTTCNPFAAPFYQGFAGGSMPSCWTNSNTTSNTSANSFWKFSGTPDYGTTGNGRPTGTYAWVDASTPHNVVVTLTSPLIDLSTITNPILEFEWYKNNTDAAPIPQVNNNLRVEGNPGGTGWVTLFDDTSNAAAWRTVSMMLPQAFINTTAQFRFVVDKNLSNDFYDDVLLDSVRVIQCTLPTVAFGNDTTLCGAGASLTLDAGSAGTSYAWSTGATTQTINVSTPGAYSVTVVNGSTSCRRSDTINVATGVIPVVNLGPDTTVCGNAASMVLDAGNPGSNFAWSSPVAPQLSAFTTQVVDLGPIVNAINTSSASTTLNTAAVYAAVTNASGCVGMDTVNVTITFTARVDSIGMTNNDPAFGFTSANDTFATAYAWNFGDNSPAVTTNNASHVYTTNGTYTVTLVVSNPCNTDTVVRTVTVSNAPNSISNVLAEGSVTLYPNPTAADATLEVSSGLKLRGVQVMSATGQLVMDRTLDGSTRTTLNTSALAPGIYTLRIQLDKGVVVRKLEVLK